MACLLLLAIAGLLGRPVSARALGGASTRVELTSAGLGSAASEYQLGYLRRSSARPEALLAGQRSEEEWFFGRRRRSRNALNNSANETETPVDDANATKAKAAKAAVDAAAAAAEAGASPEEIAEAAAAAAAAVNGSEPIVVNLNSTDSNSTNSTKAGHKWCPFWANGWLCKKSSATGNGTSAASNSTINLTSADAPEATEELAKNEQAETEEAPETEEPLETEEEAAEIEEPSSTAETEKPTKTKKKKGLKDSGARRRRRGQAVLLASGRPTGERDEGVAGARSPLTDPFSRRIDQLLGKSH